METHKLGFEIDKPEEREEYPKFMARLDDQKSYGSLVVLPLEKSAQKDGVYPILNCSCGEWGCGGYYVQVKNEPEMVIWEKIYFSPEDKKEIYPLGVKTPISFNRSQYQNVIDQLLAEKDKYVYESKTYSVDLEEFEKSGMEFGYYQR